VTPNISGSGPPVDGFAGDDSSLYIASFYNNTISRCPYANCTANAVVIASASSPRSISLGGDRVFFAGCSLDTFQGSVGSIAKDGTGGPQTYTTTGCPRTVLADATHIYWIDVGASDALQGALRRCPITGCPAAGPEVMIAGLDFYGPDAGGVIRLNEPYLADDGAAIYLSIPTSQRLLKIAK
jgi:hypothetical protein